jgi:hypothetical protein
MTGLEFAFNDKFNLSEIVFHALSEDVFLPYVTFLHTLPCQISVYRRYVYMKPQFSDIFVDLNVGEFLLMTGSEEAIFLFLGINYDTQEFN